MTDETSKDEGHLTSTQQQPVLVIDREKLTFSAGELTTKLTLDQVMQSAIETTNPIGLLLYGLILKVNDVDKSLRAIVQLGDEQRVRVQGMTAEPEKLIGAVVEQLQKLGFPTPGAPVPEPEQRPARGNGQP